MIKLVRRAWYKVKHIFSKTKKRIKSFHRSKNMKEHITPEVGDVWLYKYKEFKTEYYISAIARFKNPEYYVFVLYKNGNNQVAGRWWNEEEWEKTLLQDFTCLGHSKANIDDLFKTENEE